MTSPQPDPPDAAVAVPTVDCRHCGTTVPAGNFCGYCGMDLVRPSRGRLASLRPRVFAAAPREHVLLPMVTSTLFPQLPEIYRNPFRIGLLAMLLGTLSFSVLRLIGPLVTLVALGVPVLFMLYLWQSDVLRDIPARAFAVSAVLGIALGSGWVWLTGRLVAQSYGIPMAAGFVLQDVISIGLLISVAGGVLMVIPAIVVRIMGTGNRESLDGFAVGVLGALAFTGAARTTRLAPQFVTGLLDNVRPVRLFVEALLFGMVVPLTAAAVGGLIGILLWFRPGRRAGEHRGTVRATLLFFSLLVLAIHMANWVVEAARLATWPQLGLHLAITVVALLAARFCLQLALLHEEPDPFTEQPLLCVHCERVVPDMPFCPACGAAARASSRSSRRRRREQPPTLSAPNVADV